MQDSPGGLSGNLVVELQEGVDSGSENTKITKLCWVQEAIRSTEIWVHYWVE